MRLHKDTILFTQAIRFTADKMGIAPIYIEKDYWVTYALFTIFHNPVGTDTIFKGGTSLSKCYKMIDRFSEDIDLVVLRHYGETDSKLKAKLKKISTVVAESLPEIEIDGITRKFGMNRKTAHTYNKEFTGDYGQVRDIIILESSWLGYSEPYTTKTVQSLIGEMMLDIKQGNIADEHGLMPFEVRVLEPSRTICEKIMSLVRFSYGENPINNLKNKIRHCYDLHQLLQQAEFSNFLDSPDFDDMLLKVANDDVVSFRNNNEWLAHHPSEALIFKELENVWQELAPVFNTEFKSMVYRDLPKDENVMKTLSRIKERLEKITWTINKYLPKKNT